MTSITTRAGKGSPLTHNEVDANFTNLNNDKLDTAGIALGSAASPTLKFTGDLNTGIYSPGADQLAVATNGTGRLFVDASGNIGVGTASPTSFGAGAVMQSIVGTTGYGGYLGFTNNVTVQLWADEGGGTGQMGTRTNHPLIATVNNTERARIDSGGTMLVGTSTPSNFIGAGFNTTIQVQENAGRLGFGVERPTNDASGPSINFRKTRATSAGGVTVVQNGDNLTELRFLGTDGTGSIQAAGITAAVDGTPGTNDMPGRLVFSVTADGAASPTEALRISNDRSITVSDGGHIAVGSSTGTKIGTATTQKIGFFDKAPVVQPTAVADATDAATVITQLNALLTRMRNLGLIAT